MTHKVASAQVYPAGMLNTLSRQEVERLHDASRGDLAELLRRCALAVLNSGQPGDDAEALLARYADFELEVEQTNRGLRLRLWNAPQSAFVDGRMIQGIRELLSAVIRDLVYFDSEIAGNPAQSLETSEGISNAVFEILRNAGVLRREEPSLVVCWGGHSISREEYDYSKECGYQLGLRGLQIITGCGPGAMKGPMKGATVAHAKQRLLPGRYIGISEPGIIAAESPNPIVNELVIMPDIEKRLEAFVRLGHAIVVFPGGVGTAEEILYLLGILLEPENADRPVPVILTGPRSAEPYFERIDAFVRLTLGDDAAGRYRVIIDDPPAMARALRDGVEAVREFRDERNEPFYYDWGLKIRPEFQWPFQPSHDNMSKLSLLPETPLHQRAADLRRAFSGIVAGNVKPEWVQAVREQGPYRIVGDREYMRALDELLEAFVTQQRMKLPGSHYQPCYEVVA